MKRIKSNLDEMQELKLLKIEHSACWIAFWGLVSAIMIQLALGNDSWKNIIGETSVLLVVSVYLTITCTKNGIWDRKLKPNLNTNLFISILVGIVVGCFWFITSYYRYHALIGSIATFIFMMILTSILCFSTLTFCCRIYKNHKDKLDTDADKEEFQE